MSSALIDVPSGLNGVAVTATSIGDVLGDEGRFHYRGHDAVALARERSFEDVWHLIARGHLPDPGERAAFAARVEEARRLPAALVPLLEPMARAAGPARSRSDRRGEPASTAGFVRGAVEETVGSDPVRGGSSLRSLRAALSVAADDLGLRPLVDLAPEERDDQAVRVAAVVPAIVAALHRASLGLEPVTPDAASGHAASYLQMVTGVRPSPEQVRALEQYLVLTVDHGFNASTFTARVVASTGADLADVVGAALGALAGPLHGGAPSRALDALDAIGDPDRATGWAEAELAAGRRIMGFGHAVYRTRDPRSDLLREVALGRGGDLVERAVAVEGHVLAALRRAKPGRPLPSNVEYFAGVVMAAAGLPRALFTPTFAVSRVVGWCAHAIEQAAQAKLIRPSARYVPSPPQP